MRIVPLITLNALILSGCAPKSDRLPISIADYAELKQGSTLVAKRVSIDCRIAEHDGTIVAFRKINVPIGHKATANQSKEFTYPTSYDLPEMNVAADDGTNFPVSPANPTHFETILIGDFLSVTPSIRGPFIELNGTLTSKTVDAKTLSAGEAYAPIIAADGKFLLTENTAAAPEFQHIESTIRVCGRPGVAHRIRLNMQNREVYFTCDLLD